MNPKTCPITIPLMIDETYCRRTTEIPPKDLKPNI